MTYYLRHTNRDSEPEEHRWFPYATMEEAEAQAKHDIEMGLPVEGIFDNPTIGADELRSKEELS